VGGAALGEGDEMQGAETMGNHWRVPFWETSTTYGSFRLPIARGPPNGFLKENIIHAPQVFRDPGTAFRK